jgi:tRNA A-37 threonylcarbamoyl transferase component Bud32
MTEEVDRTLRGGRYSVTRVLGEGAQGDTLEAVDKQAGRLVAIKRFQVRGAKQWKDVELAEREAKVLASLSHPSLPVHVEHFEEGGALYLVMEKIEGESLGALRRRGAALGRDDVVRFLRDTAGILDYLHGRAPPVIHRDIKPSNVIRRPDGSFAIIDFGAVRDRMKPEGGSTVVGTFGYMAPEQFQGRALPGSDVYAAGATALALLTGEEPENLPHRGLAIDVAATLRGRADPALIEVLSAMLTPDPDQRPASIGPLLAKLRASRPPVPPRIKPERKLEEHIEERRALRAKKQARRKETRRGEMSGSWRGPPGPLLFVALVGLAIARLAVSVALLAVVPLVLTMMSVVFGRGLREAARHVRHAGRRAGLALTRAQQAVMQEEMRARERARIAEVHENERVRVRVDDPGAEELEDEAETEEEAHRRKKAVKR